MSIPPPGPAVHRQVASKGDRNRPLLLWAGRLDRQKRFDLLIGIARALPEVDFHCWGRAVLDAPVVDMVELPENLTLNPPFDRFAELPLSSCDGWIYTSAWDGLPNVVIEAGAYGMPIVASAVDGIPELLDDTTGWPVQAINDVQAYVSAIRDMLSDDDERISRAERLYRRVGERHVRARYRARFELLGNCLMNEPTETPEVDISVILTGHREQVLAGPSARSAREAIAYAETHLGLRCEIILY